jgi:hypothetical protein
MDDKEYIEQSVQWLIKHDMPIPPDLVEELHEVGLSSDLPPTQLELVRQQVKIIETQIEGIKESAKAVPLDLEPLLTEIRNLGSLLSSLPVPQVTVNVPEQPAPVINVSPAKSPAYKPRKVKVIRDKTGLITGLESEQ